MSTLLDVVDENNVLTGEVRKFSEIHKLGLFHRTSQVWLIEGDEIIFQKRRFDVTFPNFYDVSAGGHVDSGEDPRIAGVRELFEETGVRVFIDGLGENYIFNQKVKFEDIINNEFCYVYFIFSDDFDLKVSDEVSGFVKVKLVDFKNFYYNNLILFAPDFEDYYEFIFEILEKKFDVIFN